MLLYRTDRYVRHHSVVYNRHLAFRYPLDKISTRHDNRFHRIRQLRPLILKTTVAKLISKFFNIKVIV